MIEILWQNILIFSFLFNLFLIFLNIRTGFNRYMLLLCVSLIFRLIPEGIEVWLWNTKGMTYTEYCISIYLFIIFSWSGALIFTYTSFTVLNYQNKKMKILIYGGILFNIIFYVLDLMAGSLILFTVKNKYLVFSAWGIVFNIVPSLLIYIHFFYIAARKIKHITPKKKKIGRLIILGNIIYLSANFLEALYFSFFKFHNTISHYTNVTMYGLTIYIIIFMVILAEEIKALLFKKNTKYNESSFSGSPELEQHKKALYNLMMKEELYKDPDLTLSDLAERLSLPRAYVSQLFSQNLNTTFNAYLNNYRVEFLKELLKKKTKKSVLELGFEAGFNTKSTLNKAFKQITGYTPSAFKKEYAAAGAYEKNEI